jgi:riboflavin kinase/FMN adenylyltransferase
MAFMKIFKNTDEVAPCADFAAGGSVVCIGKFDGVHVGHQAILAAGRRLADAEHVPLIVLTFDPHPLSVIAPDKVPEPITPFEEKMRLLEKYGADAAYVVHFTEEFSRISAEDFMADTLVGTLNARHVVVGENFRFGHKARGDGAALRNHGGFVAHIVSPVFVDAAVVSSSRVRSALSGDTALVARLLGR